MGVENTQAAVRFPLARWSVWISVPVLVVALLVSGISLLQQGTGVLEAELLSLIPVAFGTLAGALVLSTVSARIPPAWGGVLLYAQGVRMTVSIGAGLAVFFLIPTAAFAFWLFFLAFSLIILGAEVAFVLKWIRTAETEAGREDG